MNASLVLAEVVNTIDRAIESQRVSLLHSARRTERDYFEGGVQALRGLRKDLTGESRTADEQAHARVEALGRG